MTKRERRNRYAAICGGLLLTLVCLTPVRAQDNDRKILKKVEAQYPSILKRRGIGGTVRLKVAIHADGFMNGQDFAGYYFFYQGSLQLVAGTSCASPTWAGALADTERDHDPVGLAR